MPRAASPQTDKERLVLVLHSRVHRPIRVTNPKELRGCPFAAKPPVAFRVPISCETRLNLALKAGDSCQATAAGLNRHAIMTSIPIPDAGPGDDDPPRKSVRCDSIAGYPSPH